MKNSFGSSVCVTLFGESHGLAVGAVIDGLAPGIRVDEDYIKKQLERRRSIEAVSTGRREADVFLIESGVFNGFTTGTPICISIRNENKRHEHYDALRTVARPGHADYTAQCKYHGFQDYRGGGHFSGRVTAALTAAGSIFLSALRGRGIIVSTHVKECGGEVDTDFDFTVGGAALYEQCRELGEKLFPVIDPTAEERMSNAIIAASAQGDSVGGILETVVLGLPAGLGEPFWDSAESLLAHGIFSIPAIKGVEFGAGFGTARMKGSEMNDSLTIEAGDVKTATNNSGGINGGITNGMPVTIRCAVKPTSSIFRPQRTVDFEKLEETELKLEGRHDPCIAHRAAVVVDSVVAAVLCDMLAQRFGTDWIGGNGFGRT